MVLALRNKMHFHILFPIALLYLPFAHAQASWKKISVKGSYPGRGETAFSRCGGSKLCLLGGRGANRVHLMDTETLTWSPGRPNSLEMHHFQAFQGPDECVWVAGAWTGPYPNEATIDNIWRYCPDTNEWYKGDPISRPRGSGGAFYHNGKVYLVTGNVGGHRKGATVVPWFDSYDPKTGKWEQLPNIPNARDHVHAVVRNNKVYVAGGRRSTSNAPEFFDDTVAEVDVFDFDSRKWSTVTSLDRPRGGTASAVYNNSVYVIGGEGDNRAWTEVDVLDNSILKHGASMMEPRHGTGVVSCNGAIWIAGGARVLGGGNNAKDTYAFFEGNTPPPCRDDQIKKPSASPSPSVEGGPHHDIGVDDESTESTPDALLESPIPSPSEMVDSASFPRGRSMTSAPVESSKPSASPVAAPSAAETPSSSPQGIDSVDISSGPALVSTLESSAPTASPLESVTLALATSSETIDSVAIPSAPVMVSTPIESSSPTASPPELNFDEEQTEQTMVEESPEPSSLADPLEPVRNNHGAVQSFSTASKEIPEDDFTVDNLLKDRPTSQKKPYGETPIPFAESVTNVEGSPAANSPTASPRTVDINTSTSPSSSGIGSPSSSVITTPTNDASSTPVVTFVHSGFTPVPSLVASEELHIQDESSPRPVTSEIHMIPDETNGVSPEPTTLVEIITEEEEAQVMWTEEPLGSNILIEDEELFDELDPSPSDFDEETSSCFPSDAVVELEDGSKKPMALLRIGDRVKVAHPDTYSEVFFFSHMHPETTSAFLQLSTSAEGVSLTLSPGHLLYANGMLVEASSVRIGDRLLLGDSTETVAVTEILVLKRSGLHHPHTLHGDIVVNGVVASTYTSAVHPRLARILLAPFKTVFYVLRNEVYVTALNKVVLRALDATWWKR